jgi:hypothetical protein
MHFVKLFPELEAAFFMSMQKKTEEVSVRRFLNPQHFTVFPFAKRNIVMINQTN